MKNVRIALLVGAGALLIGAVGPWASMLGVINVGPTANGETAAVVFGGAAILAVSAFTLRATRAISISVGLLALAESIYTLVKIADIKSSAGEFGGLIQPGWGVYLTVIAGLYLVVSTFVVKRTGNVPVAA
jgi:hypothetical protein